MFAFKQEVKIDFDGTNYIFDIDTNKFRKITSRRFPNLIGENKWNSVGVELLDVFYQIESQAFDNWYTIRGLLAEDLADKYIKQWIKSQKGIEITTVHFAPQQFDGYDQFKDNQYFGGVIDIAIASPKEERAVIEVKGKSISALGKVELERPQEEVTQGEQLAFLSKVDKYYMCYVFFDETQEAKMKKQAENISNSGKKIGDVCYQFASKIIEMHNISINDVVIKVYEYTLNKEKTQERMKKAYNEVMEFKKTKKIHASKFKLDEKTYLNSFIPSLKDEDIFKQYINTDKDDLFTL